MSYPINTSQGSISVWEKAGEELTLVFLHPNSSCKEAFSKQMEEPLLKNFRRIAIDLPGHGRSDNATDPSSYSMPGYADVVAEVVDELSIKNPVFVGWSLGGHVALELINKIDDVRGVVLSGTPPIPMSLEGMHKGFKPIPAGRLMGQESFTDEEAEEFTKGGGFSLPEDAFALEATKRTDGLARKNMIGSALSGVGADETEIVASSEVPIAVIGGRNDEGVNYDYIAKEVPFKNLWQNKVHLIDDAGHGVLWEKAEEFNKLLAEFLSDLSKV